MPGWGHREGQGQAWNILSWRNTAKFYQILALSYNSQLWCKMFFYSDSENVFAVQLYFYSGTNVFIFQVHVYLYLQCSSRAELGGCS